MQVKDRAAEKVRAVPEPLIWAPRSWLSETAYGILDPPPPLKGRKAGGSGMVFIVVDPGAPI
jgi:hypothetical protein